MVELLTTFNPVTIIIVIVMVCIALKKTNDWFDWAKKVRDKSYERDKAIQQSIECAEQHKKLAEKVDYMSSHFRGDDFFDDLKMTISTMQKNLDTSLSRSDDRYKELNQKYDGVAEGIKDIQKGIAQLKDDFEQLRKSDVDDIKGYIIDQHQKFMELGYIDDQHLEVLDKRFKHYQKQGGNTYVVRLMEDLMALPLKSTKAVTEWKKNQGGHL